MRWFDDYRELLGELAGSLDAVVISTPIPLHLPMLEAAMDRGLAVLLEKPPVPLVQDFLRLDAWPEARRVAVAFQRLASPNLWRLKRAMLDGALGRIHRMAATACWPRRDSYYNRAAWSGHLAWNGLPVLDGPATNALAHIVHNLMFLAGETPEAFAVPETVRAELYRARPIESYDLCCVGGCWASEVEFVAAFTHAAEQTVDWSLLVEGERGTARIDGRSLSLDSGEDAAACEENDADLPKACWLDFQRAATGHQAKPLTSFADCRAYVAATNAMFVSSGRIHTLPDSAVRRYETGGDVGYDVRGIAELLAATAATGKLFSEQDVPWAIPGSPVPAAELAVFPWEKFC